MRYIKIDNGIWVAYDEVAKNVVETINLPAVKNRINELQEKLDSLPPLPNNTQLLSWAKINYPVINRTEEKKYLETEIERLSIIVDTIKQ